jgi:hypothetical protein
VSTQIRKIILPFVIGLTGFIVVLLIIGFVLFPRPNLPPMVTEEFCSRNNIHFNSDSIEYIYFHPEDILTDPEKFLEEDRAYQLLAQHRERINDPFKFDSWLSKIKNLASLSEDRRKEQVSFRLYELIITHQESFCEEVAANVLSYLPEETEIDVTIYLTALEGSAAAFAAQQEIVFSLSHPLLVNTSVINQSTGLSAFYNLGLHELFHIGFAANFEHLSKEEHRKNEIIVDVLTVLQNEGIATHISHRMNPEYPTPFEWFIYLVDNETIVRWFIGEINEILADGSPPPPLGEAYNQIYQRIGKIGYRWNGLYIVGGYMAMTIEDQLGRGTLVRTIQDGFYSFAETYNTLAPEDMKIIWELNP